MAVDNFKIESSSFNETANEYTLQFSFTNTDTSDSGYELHSVVSLFSASGDEIEEGVEASDTTINTYINTDVLQYADDRELTISDDGTGKIILNAVISADILGFGSPVSFYLQVYNKENTDTYQTQTIRFNPPITKIDDLVTHYDGSKLHVEWSDITSTNPSLIKYVVERATPSLVLPFTIERQLISNIIFRVPDLEIGDFVVVKDILHNRVWSKVSDVKGFLVISNADLKNVLEFIIYLNLSELNFQIYKVTDDDFSEFTTISPETFDGDFLIPQSSDDSLHAFRVHGTGGVSSIKSTPSVVEAIDIRQRIPQLYPAMESQDDSYGNPYFSLMRDMLVDANIYKKNQFSLPMKEVGDYSIRGQAWLSNAFINLIINGDIYRTVRTDTNGEFQISFNRPEKDFTITILAISENNTQQSVALTGVDFNKVNTHTVFAVTGNSLVALNDEGVLRNYNDSLIAQADIDIIKGFYAPTVGLTPFSDDADDDFRAQVAFLYPLLIADNDKGGTVGLAKKILNFYRDNGYGMDFYEIFENGDLTGNHNNAWNLGQSILTPPSSLENRFYRYYITSKLKSSSTHESFPITIAFDYRFFAVGEVSNFPAISFAWESAGKKADIEYNIYREDVLEGDIKHLTTVDSLNFIDTGDFALVDKEFPTFGYSDVPRVPGISYYSNMVLFESAFLQSENNFVAITIYEEEGFGMNAGVKQRLRDLFEQISRPESYLVLKFL